MMIYRVVFLFIFLILLSACGNTPAAVTSIPTSTPIPTLPPTETPVEVLSSLSYAEDDMRQKLDVYLPPTGEKPYPTILAIHGGGFIARSKSLYRDIGPYYARQGYAFIAINYRLVPAYSFPAQVEVSFCALAWLHANHEKYGFDPNRVVVMGGSAGGYLAAMLGTVDDPGIYLENCPNDDLSGEPVHAAAIYYGFFDFTNIDDFPQSGVDRSLVLFWGSKYDNIPAERLEEMSPIKQIDGSDPPFILLHGLLDLDVPSVMSERFAEALAQAGVDVELVLLPDAAHAFELRSLTSDVMTLSLGRTRAFLERVLAP